MSPREELMKRIDDLCGLNPKAIGVGGGIDRQSSPLWRARFVENSYREMRSHQQPDKK